MRLRQVWCKAARGVLRSACRGVELAHELAVCGAGRGQVLVTVVELEAEVDGLLLEVC